jgi:hypothetical protein
LTSGKLPPVPMDFRMPWTDLRYSKAELEADQDRKLEKYFKEHE